MHTIADLKAGLLSKATRLQISENLTHFPTEIYDLADTLEVLDLSHNQLSELPEDFARLSKLKVLFLSNNQFKQVPAVLSQCDNLEMIGFKANQIVTVPDGALPLSTRWLILTENKIEALPQSMGDLRQLQKLMLAGNVLQSLPESMVACRALQLIRLSANQLTELPEFLLQLPKLAWLAFAGNPFCVDFGEAVSGSVVAIPEVSFDDVTLGDELGQGASGVIYKAEWVKIPAGITESQQNIAVKKYKGHVTSDGDPRDELHACLAAGQHPNLVPVIAKIEQPGQLGLVMNLIDSEYTNLGEPPTFQSCTRDYFPDDFMLTVSAVLKITRSMLGILLHLRGRGICHGDIYAHNILTNADADVLFGDFGATSSYTSLSSAQADALERIEVRAFACLLEDLLGSSCDSDDCPDLFEPLVLLKNRCMHPKVYARPTFADIKSDLDAIK